MNKQVRWLALTAIGTLLAAAAAWTGVLKPHTTPNLSVAVADSLGAPVTNLFLIFTDNKRLEPSLDGVFLVPSSRAGTEASLRENSTRREVCRFVVPRGGQAFLRVTLPTGGGGDCRVK